MKIAYVDHYHHGGALHKDPLTIPSALKNLGHDVTLISCIAGFADSTTINDFQTISLETIERLGWNSFGFSGVVLVSRLDAKFMHTARQIRDCGLQLVIKADTDGTWGYPLPPNYLRARSIMDSLIVNSLRQLKWRLPTKYWVGKKLDQIALADAVVVESPGAAVNAIRILLHWRLDILAQKIHFIPNPVSPIALSLPLSEQRCNRIVTVGRWEDRGVKNTETMLCVIRDFLQRETAFDVEIIGSGLRQSEVAAYVGQYIDQGRVSVIPELPYATLQERFRQAKIILVPSMLESFCFVAAEALCAGASIVVTPIESLSFLAGGGRWGAVSRGFESEEILAALMCEVNAWECGERIPSESAGYWRRELDPLCVATRFMKILT